MTVFQYAAAKIYVQLTKEAGERALTPEEMRLKERLEPVLLRAAEQEQKKKKD